MVQLITNPEQDRRQQAAGASGARLPEQAIHAREVLVLVPL